MGSLLAKAISYNVSLTIENNNHPKKAESSSEDYFITKEEKQVILLDIDNLVSKSRTIATDALFTLKAKKKGVLFPVIINISAIIVICLGIYLFSELFRVEQTNIIQGKINLTSAGSRLIAELKKETEAKLREKSAEIEQIRKHLEELELSRATLKANRNADIKNKEQELIAGLETELEREKARLSEQAITDREMDYKLEVFEENLKLKNALEMEKYRSKLDGAIQEKELELLREEELARGSLQKINKERVVLLEEIKKGAETELKTTLLPDSSPAEQELLTLSEAAKREELLNKQITSFYSIIMEQVKASDLEAAARSLDELRDLLQKESVEVPPAVLNRRRIEFFIIDSLKKSLSPQQLVQAPEKNDTELPGKQEKIIQNMLKEIETLKLDVLKANVKAANLESLESNLLKEAEILKLDVLKANVKVAGFESLERRINNLTARYEMYKKETAKLVYSESEDNYLEAERLLYNSLNTEGVQYFFPGFSELLRNIQQRVAGSVEERAMGEGRESALQDIILFVKYLSGLRTEIDEDVYDKIAYQAQKEPLFQAAINEIQTLVVGDLDKQGENIFNFLGTIAVVSGSQIVIEPLVTLPIEKGSRIIIKRFSEMNKEENIAEGAILQVSDKRILAVVEEILEEGNVPGEMDMVYVQVKIESKE
ncbi:MAG TPA: hypothetical protein ENI06_00520 [Spirochaetales bacterium]|nr:hypothetical protein [Spirochaetales bacterium]